MRPRDPILRRSRPEAPPDRDGGALSRTYHARRRRRGLYLLGAVLALVCTALAACCMGVADLTPGRLLATWLPPLGDLLSAQPLDQTERNVLLMLRLPRVAMAVVAGAGLGVSGTVMQAITGNSMASPFTTGLSNAAALGAALVILFGGFPVYLQETATVLAAFAMALLCAALVYGISSLRGLGPETLVLTGIALNYLFNAVNSSMQYIANEQQLPAIVHWTFGSLTAASWGDIGVMAVFLALVYPLFASKAWAMNLMASNGDESASALGVNVRDTRLALGIGVALLTASVVSFTGIIGFVGLVIPHVVRMVFGTDHKKLLPLSALLGAIFLIWADVLCRIVLPGNELPIGVLTSLVGAPVFVYLMARRKYGFGGGD